MRTTGGCREAIESADKRRDYKYLVRERGREAVAYVCMECLILFRELGMERGLMLHLKGNNGFWD